MKFLHLADLHIGKRIFEMSLLEDQAYVLDQAYETAVSHHVDAVVIAGDVYDKAIPSAEATTVLSVFLSKLVGAKIPVLVVSGNHDSPERLDFGSAIMTYGGVYIAGSFGGDIQKVTLTDSLGAVDFYLLPFIKPAMVHDYFADQVTDSYDAAVRAVISSFPLAVSRRSVLIAHQFVVSGTAEPEVCDSETRTVGMIDQVDTSIFSDFDYVALGHIHGQQKIGCDTVRYAGSPLKYSFSECRHRKSMTLVNLGMKGQVDIRQIPFVPLHEMREIYGPLEELISHAENCDDYIHATLTDEHILDALGKLRCVYPFVLKLDFDNAATRAVGALATIQTIEDKSPMELFESFYEAQNGIALDGQKRRIVGDMLAEVEGAL